MLIFYIYKRDFPAKSPALIIVEVKKWNKLMNRGKSLYGNIVRFEREPFGTFVT